MRKRKKFKIIRLNLLIYIVSLLFIILFINLFYVQIVKNEYYNNWKNKNRP